MGKILRQTKLYKTATAYLLKHLTTNDLNNAYLQQLLLLWNKEYPEQLAYTDVSEFRSYLATLVNQQHVLVLDADDTISGWAFIFTREGERWFAVILDESVQGQGIGTALMNILKQNELCLNGWVTDHDRYLKKDQKPYRPPIDFYLKNGFTVSDTRLETDKLSAVKITWSR
jgi:GNAT superfamily N-acetyltransferase